MHFCHLEKSLDAKDKAAHSTPLDKVHKAGSLIEKCRVSKALSDRVQCFECKCHIVKHWTRQTTSPIDDLVKAESLKHWMTVCNASSANACPYLVVTLPQLATSLYDFHGTEDCPRA